MEERRFDPKKLEKLNDPERVLIFPPQLIIERANLDHPRTMIDLGAGTGFFSVQFAKFFKDCKIYAYDISEVMVDWMKENIVPENGNIIPQLMEDSQIQLEDQVADFLYMVNLHHELYNPEKTLAECHRLLKPSGKIAISDWRKEETGRGPSVEIRYEPDKVVDQLMNAGFKHIEVFDDLPQNFLIIADK